MPKGRSRVGIGIDFRRSPMVEGMCRRTARHSRAGKRVTKKNQSTQWYSTKEEVEQKQKQKREKDEGRPRQAYEARWEGEDIILIELHLAR